VLLLLVLLVLLPLTVQLVVRRLLLKNPRLRKAKRPLKVVLRNTSLTSTKLWIRLTKANALVKSSNYHPVLWKASLLTAIPCLSVSLGLQQVLLPTNPLPHPTALRINTIQDLGNWKHFKVSRALAALANTEEKDKRAANSVMNINKCIDKEHHTKTLGELVAAPVSALNGLAEW